MASVTLRNLAKRFGDVEVLHDIDLEIANGEFIVMVGPSGCGKSTLLRMIAGLESISDGSLLIDDVIANDMPAAQRGVGMVFQTYALYPHMTVRENLVFALKLVHMNNREMDARVQRAAEFLKLTPYLDRLPKALSGGQRQRVAIGRAIIRDPRIFLFDEPLSNLDAALRVATRIKIADLNDSLPDTTMIYVTHDQVEAMTLADRIVVLSDTGGIEQVGTPLQLYHHPANLFVACFIGSPAMNILPGRLIAAGADTTVVVADQPPFAVPIPTDPTLSGATIRFGVRPEDLRIAEGDEWLIEGKLAHLEALGDITQIYIDVGLEETDEKGQEESLLVVKLPGTALIDRGSRLRLAADVGHVHLFDESGRTLDRRRHGDPTPPITPPLTSPRTGSDATREGASLASA